MKNSCIIKSNPLGITLFLNAEISFEILVKDVCKKFLQSRDFFGKTDLVVRFTGRILSMEEEAVLVEAIELNSDIHIRFIQDKDSLDEKRLQKDIAQYEKKKRLNESQYYFKSVSPHEKLNAKKGLIITGDVKEDACVSADGNVLVMGTIFGTVKAGQKGDLSCVIYAHAVSAEANLQIADITRIQTPGNEKKTHFPFFSANKPDCIKISIKDSMLVQEGVTF